MKNHIVLFFSCLLPYLSLSAQDVITLTNGKEIQAIVTEVMQKEIKYKRFDNPNGPVYTLDKSSVSVIKYQNGTKDVINENLDGIATPEQIKQMNSILGKHKVYFFVERSLKNLN